MGFMPFLPRKQSGLLLSLLHRTVYRRIHGYFFTHLCTPRRRPRRSHSRRRRDVIARRGHARDVSVVVDARVRVYDVVVDDGVVVEIFQGRDASAGVRDAARASRRGRRRVRVQGWDDAGVHGGWVVRAGDGDRRARGERRDAGTDSWEFFCVCARARARSRRCRSTRRRIHSFIHSFFHSRVGWVTRRDATSVGETATVMDVERGEGRRGRRWRENAPFRSFVRSFVRSFARRVHAVDANARVDASRRACRPRVSFRDAAARETRGDDG